MPLAIIPPSPHFEAPQGTSMDLPGYSAKKPRERRGGGAGGAALPAVKLPQRLRWPTLLASREAGLVAVVMLALPLACP